MISFISGTLLKEEPCCKFILKYDIKNYFRHFRTTLAVCFQWNTTHIDLVMCNYVWLEQLNVCVRYRIPSNKNILFYWVKFVNYIKLFNIQGTVCLYHLKKIGLLKYVKSKFRHVFSLSCIWKKDGKVFGKNTTTFWHNIAYKVNAFIFRYIWQLRLIAYKNYSTFCTRNCQN